MLTVFHGSWQNYPITCPFFFPTPGFATRYTNHMTLEAFHQIYVIWATGAEVLPEDVASYASFRRVYEGQWKSTIKMRTVSQHARWLVLKKCWKSVEKVVLKISLALGPPLGLGFPSGAVFVQSSVLAATKCLRSLRRPSWKMRRRATCSMSRSIASFRVAWMSCLKLRGPTYSR